MYSILLLLHSLIRWLVLFALLVSLYKAAKGYFSNAAFTAVDNKIRHWTATIGHVQLIVGFILYIKSPIPKYFFSSLGSSWSSIELSFFAVYHFLFMFLAIVLLTIGSAKAKRKEIDREKFQTVLLWYGLALFIILLAIPWPFSPLVHRPYLRTF